MRTTKEIRGQLDDRRRVLHEVFEQAGEHYDMDKVTVLEGDSAGKVDQIRSLNNEIDDLAVELEATDEMAGIQRRVEGLGDIDRPAIHPSGSGRKTLEQKSVGQLFVESDAYAAHKIGTHGKQSELDIGIEQMQSAVFLTTAGWAPESLRTGRVVDFALRPLQVTDIVPRGDTNSAAVVYMEETTATSAAAERAEGATYAQSTLALTQKTVTVRSIGTSIPVTDEQLDDVAQAQSYVEGRLGFFVLQRLDSQLLLGDGTGANITGYLNASGLQTQAKGADPGPDAVYKAMTKIRVTGRAFPSAAVFHPTNWQDIKLLRTADGIYIWGNPADAAPDRIWGLIVAQCDAITLGTALVGDFSPAWSQLFIRRGLMVEMGFVNTDFTDGKQSIRAGIRGALVVYRGPAFSTVTGL